MTQTQFRPIDIITENPYHLNLFNEIKANINTLETDFLAANKPIFKDYINWSTAFTNTDCTGTKQYYNEKLRGHICYKPLIVIDFAKKLQNGFEDLLFRGQVFNTLFNKQLLQYHVPFEKIKPIINEVYSIYTQEQIVKYLRMVKFIKDDRPFDPINKPERYMTSYEKVLKKFGQEKTHTYIRLTDCHSYLVWGKYCEQKYLYKDAILGKLSRLHDCQKFLTHSMHANGKLNEKATWGLFHILDGYDYRATPIKITKLPALLLGAAIGLGVYIKSKWQTAEA